MKKILFLFLLPILVFAQVHTISSFTPTTGPIGTTVTISGSNFSTTPANNIVYFGVVKATVTSASATQLTVTVPTGATYQPITVTVNGLTAYSSKPFIVTYSSSQIIDATTFSTKTDFTSGNYPASIAIGDIDGDGKSDLAVVNNLSNTFSVYRNISTSGSISSASFAAKVDFAAGTSPRGIAIGDIDGDGKLDITITNQGSNTISVFRNISTSGSIISGSFGSKVDFAAGTNPSYVALGDIDGDGKSDLAVVNALNNNVSIFRNTGTSGSITSGSFAAKIDFATGSNPAGVAIGDIDGDGKPELVVANYNNNTVSIFRNTSASGSITTGSFAVKIDFTTGSGPHPVIICDIDGDGKPDLTVTNYLSNTVSVLRNTSTTGAIVAGSLTTKVDFNVGSAPRGASIGDFDGDGKPDIAVANAGGNTVSIFKNTSTSGSIGAGSLAAKVDVATGVEPWDVVIGDIDGDGKPDFAVANASGNTVSVFRNTITSSVLVPTITSFTPSSGAVGSFVTITGTNFGTTQGTSTVKFGTSTATVSGWSATQIVAAVPSLPTGLSYNISVTTTGGSAISSTQFFVTTSTSYADPIPPMYKTTVSTAVTSSYINYMTEKFGTLWMIGDGGIVARATSMSAGSPVSWSLSNAGISSLEDIYAIEFASALVGFIGTGSGKIYRTTDGGSSWNLVYNQTGVTNFINFIKFDNTSTGMATGDGISSTSAMAFLSTTDGGTTWINKNSNIVGSTSLSQVFFVSANTGFLAGSSTFSGKTYRGIFRTTNGGTNWNFYTVGNTSADSVRYTETFSFNGASIGMAVKSDSTVWKTSNGGAAWTKVGQLPQQGFGAVYTSGSTIFIAGRRGMVAQVNTSNNVIYSTRLDETLTLSSPAYSSAFSAVLLPVYNQIRSYFSSVNPSTPLTTPTLQLPSSGSQLSSTSTTLFWSNVSGATAYDLEVGTSISSSIRGKLFTSSAASYGVSDLSPGVQYLWRIRARSTTNSSAWSQTSSFSVLPTQQISEVVSASFPLSPKSSSDYRLVTVPNVTSTTVSDNIPGNAPDDYRIYFDNGGTPPNHLTEMNGSSLFNIGTGYWLIKKNNFVISNSIFFPTPSTTTGAVSISTRTGWNIIGTPFAVPVKWSDIRAANSLATSAIAYGYYGVKGYLPAEILEPFNGYYYFSNTSTLSIPFPFSVTPDLNVQEPAMQLTLVHSSSTNSDRYLKIGIDEAAQDGMDEFEERKPPIFSDQAAIWIERPEWDAKHSRFATDIRTSLGDGQTWDVVLQHPVDQPSRLSLENMKQIPEGFDVVLIDKHSGVMMKPDMQNGFAILQRKGTSTFSIIIGKQSYIRSQTEPFIPQEYVLHQNYPNPFNPSTSIRFGIVNDAFVQVKVYDLLGREISVIVNGLLPGGNHEYSFKANTLASGTYLYSLRATSATDGKILYISTKKMILLK